LDGLGQSASAFNTNKLIWFKSAQLASLRLNCRDYARCILNSRALILSQGPKLRFIAGAKQSGVKES